MSLFPALTKAGKTRARCRDLALTSDKIMHDQKQLTVAYSKLDGTVHGIKIAIKDLANRNLEVLKDAIDERDVPKEYKEELKNELEKSRKAAINTLVPLRVKADKLCANMLVSQEKALELWTVLRAQKNILESGTIQLKILRDLHDKGSEMGKEIEKILQECEEINGVGSSSVRSVIDIGKSENYSRTESLIPENPFIAERMKKNGTADASGTGNSG